MKFTNRSESEEWVLWTAELLCHSTASKQGQQPTRKNPSLCLQVLPSKAQKQCWSTAPRAQPLTLYSKTLIAFWNSLLAWLPDVLLCLKVETWTQILISPETAKWFFSVCWRFQIWTKGYLVSKAEPPNLFLQQVANLKLHWLPYSKISGLSQPKAFTL